MKLARFFVNDARSADRENGETDFRFYNGGDDLLICAVQVQRIGRQEPGLADTAASKDNQQPARFGGYFQILQFICAIRKRQVHARTLSANIMRVKHYVRETLSCE